MKNKITYNYNKLRGKIKEVFEDEQLFAPEIGMSRVSLSYKLNNKVSFSQHEISKSAELLNITDEEINLYFFTQ